MKKLLAFCLLLTFNCFANDYETVTINCKLSGESETISNPRGTELPNSTTMRFLVTYISGTRKIVKVSDESDKKGLIDLPQIKKVRGGYLNSRAWNAVAYTLKFDSLSKTESEELLEKLGATDVPNLPKGFKLGKVRVGYYSSSVSNNLKSQVHFKTTERDGLSYHINIKCQKSYQYR